MADRRARRASIAALAGAGGGQPARARHRGVDGAAAAIGDPGQPPGGQGVSARRTPRRRPARRSGRSRTAPAVTSTSSTSCQPAPGRRARDRGRAHRMQAVFRPEKETRAVTIIGRGKLNRAGSLARELDYPARITEAEEGGDPAERPPPRRRALAQQPVGPRRHVEQQRMAARHEQATNGGGPRSSTPAQRGGPPCGAHR